MKPDNGYISNYLIHWTSKKGDEEGAQILSRIASTCRLLLSYNPIHSRDMYYSIHDKMVCFTDVPLSHSAQHCGRYGRFGIAFHKLRLMNVGVEPVTYVTHSSRDYVNTIFEFLLKQSQNPTIDPDVLKALQHRFYYTQLFSDGKADETDTHYYEREWRLGQQSLVPAGMLERPDNPLYHILQEGYPLHHGKLVVDDDNAYFQFDKMDVAFLVVPRAWQSEIENPHAFEVHDYERLVTAMK